MSQRIYLKEENYTVSQQLRRIDSEGTKHFISETVT